MGFARLHSCLRAIQHQAIKFRRFSTKNSKHFLPFSANFQLENVKLMTHFPHTDIREISLQLQEIKRKAFAVNLETVIKRSEIKGEKIKGKGKQFVIRNMWIHIKGRSWVSGTKWGNVFIDYCGQSSRRNFQGFPGRSILLLESNKLMQKLEVIDWNEFFKRK